MEKCKMVLMIRIIREKGKERRKGRGMSGIYEGRKGESSSRECKV